MSKDQIQRNKQVAHQIFEQIWNKNNFEDIEDLIAPHAKFHIRNQTAQMSPDDTKRIVSGWHSIFPDFSFTIEDLVAEGDRVALRLILSGTQQATWKDIPATGKHVRVTAMMFLRFEEGKVVEIWEDFDEFGMRQQLSVL
jgi:steroid delta-isomerase-like uncharacterized protein